jgi:hypothetical protein
MIVQLMEENLYLVDESGDRHHTSSHFRPLHLRHHHPGPGELEIGCCHEPQKGEENAKKNAKHVIEVMRWMHCY